MKKELAVLAMVVLSCFCMVYKVEAGAKVEVPVVSGYLFRGLLLNDEAVVQPLVTASAANGFAVYTWGNFDLTDHNMFGNDNSRGFSEVDLTVEYTPPLPIPNATISFGCAQYLYPDPTYAIPASPAEGVNAKPTRELYAVIATTFLLEPTLSVYFDIDSADGAFYGNFKIGQSLLKKDKITLSANASIGYANSTYNRYYLSLDRSAVNELNVGLKAIYTLNDAISFSASAAYCTLLDSKVDDAAEEVWRNDGDTVIGSVGATYSF